MPIAGTSYTETGVKKQTNTGTLESGTYTNVRSLGAVITPESTLVKSKAIAQGFNENGNVEFVAGAGNVPFESGPDENTFQGFWPIGSAMRADPTPPAHVAFTNTYTIAIDTPLSNGINGTKITHVGGGDFTTMIGVTGFTARLVNVSDAANAREVAIERCWNDGADDIMEIAQGYAEGIPLDPAAPELDVYYGPPMADATEVFTIQVGRRTVQGSSGILERYSMLQKYGPFQSPRWAAIQDFFVNDVTMKVAAGANIEYDMAFSGGATTPNEQLNPALPPPLSTFAAGAPLVMGIVAEGATEMDVDGGAGVETFITGDVFTVAGVQGVYTVQADAAAVAGVISGPGVTFLPATPFGGLPDDAAISLIHSSAAFSPEFILPQSTVLARADGGPGGFSHLGIVTRNTRQAVLLDCDGGMGGLVDVTMSLTGGNTRQDDELCVSPTETVPGTLVPMVVANLKLYEDALANRPSILTRMGRTGPDKQKCRVDLVHQFEKEDPAATAPASIHWHFEAGQADAFGFINAEKDGVLTGTMTIECFRSKNAEGEIANPVAHTYYEEL